MLHGSNVKLDWYQVDLIDLGWFPIILLYRSVLLESLPLFVAKPSLHLKIKLIKKPLPVDGLLLFSILVEWFGNCTMSKKTTMRVVADFHSTRKWSYLKVLRSTGGLGWRLGFSALPFLARCQYGKSFRTVIDSPRPCQHVAFRTPVDFRYQGFFEPPVPKCW